MTDAGRYRFRIGDRVRSKRYPRIVGTVVAYSFGGEYTIRFDDGSTEKGCRDSAMTLVK